MRYRRLWQLVFRRCQALLDQPGMRKRRTGAWATLTAKTSGAIGRNRHQHQHPGAYNSGWSCSRIPLEPAVLGDTRGWKVHNSQSTVTHNTGRSTPPSHQDRQPPRLIDGADVIVSRVVKTEEENGNAALAAEAIAQQCVNDSKNSPPVPHTMSDAAQGRKCDGQTMLWNMHKHIAGNEAAVASSRLRLLNASSRRLQKATDSQTCVPETTSRDRRSVSAPTWAAELKPAPPSITARSDEQVAQHVSMSNIVDRDNANSECDGASNARSLSRMSSSSSQDAAASLKLLRKKDQHGMLTTYAAHMWNLSCRGM